MIQASTLVGDQEADDVSEECEKNSEKEAAMVLCVYTAQLDGKWKETATALDTTMKSKDPLGLVFAPDDPHMVFTLKRGRLSTAAYRTWYLDVLRRSYRSQRAHWEVLLARPLVVLLCYCRPEQFCHRYLLAETLTTLGAAYRGEILAAGRIVAPQALRKDEPVDL
jgi:hypothetical protein